VLFFIKKNSFSEQALFVFSIFGASIGLFLSAFFSVLWFYSGSLTLFDATERGAVLVVVLLSILVHELGHSVFAYLNGIGFRPIGFSVYLLYPVFYANVSGIGELGLKPKISINLAGIALQSWFMLGVLIAWVFTGWSPYYTSLQYLSFLVLFNLNPLLTTDGYWCYKDLVTFYKGKPHAIYAERLYAIATFVFSLYLLGMAWAMTKNLWFFVFSAPWSFGGFMGAFLNLYLLVLVSRGLVLRLKDSHFALGKYP
jgi:hypothetical protein